MKVKNLPFPIAACFALVMIASAQSDLQLKTPKNYIRTPFVGFNGSLFLDTRFPAVIFVAFPAPYESTEDLSTRAADSVVRILGQGGQTKSVKWKSQSRSTNENDVAESGTFKTAFDGATHFQVLTIAREWNGKRYVYGYAATKRERRAPVGYKVVEMPANATLEYWLDESGRGVIAFDKFRKSLPQGK